jgi:putative membrane protein
VVGEIKDNIYRVPATSKARVALRVFSNLCATVILLLVVVRVFPQLGSIVEYLNALWVIVLLAALNVVIWPLLMRSFLGLLPKISPAFALIAFPIVSLMLTAVFLEMAGRWSPGLVINGFRSALLIALLMVVISLVFASMFAEDDESVIYRWILKRASTKLMVREGAGKPGIVFLEIDGLGGKALKDAMNMGKTPNMKRWADRGSHKLIVWDSDLSSQTSAAQAGILHGNNSGIPAFRWYDKAKRNIVVSSSTGDVSQIEKGLSDGNGLLSNGGTARASLLSGDASRVLMTASRVFEVASDDLAAYYAYFLNPSNMLRSLSLMGWEWVLEKQAAWSQRLRNERPRISRGGIYFILRSLMTVFLRDFSLFALKGDMYSGVPYVYVTLAGYDEVSHHSGIRRPDTLEVLRKLDRELGKLEKVARHTTRRYKFVVLSDHGHTQGATFKDRYGESLVDVVRRFVKEEGKEYRVAGYGTRHESAYYIEAAFRDYRFSNSRLGNRIRGRLSNNEQYVVGKEEENNIVVLASGNLGLVSFTTMENRLSFEEIEKEFPGLLPGLVAHPGVGFVMVHSIETGAVALGKNGRMYLSTGVTEGENPLADYGPLARQNLVRTDGFTNAPDILVMSTYWKDADEVAAFEEQVASHGGTGGEQSRPFILYPGEFHLGTDKVVGAEAVYKIFKRWTNEVRQA